MDIKFPSGLEFLRDLCPQWPDPPASETGMREIAGILRDTAGWYRNDLIPELAGVPVHTAAVLTGDTADAFARQFTQLLSGTDSVHDDVDALEWLADLADNQATQIQYFKLMAISTLVITAATIAVALFNADWSLGASLAEIPIAELLAENTIRQLAAMVLEEIGEALAATLTRTALASILIEGGVGAAIGAGQELLVQGFQDFEGWRSGIDPGQVGKNALALGVSGTVAGVVGHDLGELLGQDGALPIRVFKGGVTGAASGVAANAVGNFVGGNDVGANTFLGAALGFAGGFAPGHAEAAATGLDAQATDSAVPRIPIDTHPTLRLERQPDGTFAWPGETTNGTEPQAHTVSFTPTTEPAAAGSEHGASTPAGNGWSGTADPARAVEGATPGRAPIGQDVAGEGHGSTSTLPAAAEAGHLPGNNVTAVLDPPPATHASVGSNLPEGTLDPSIISPATSARPLTTTASPAVSPPPLQSNAVSPAAQTVSNGGPSSPAPIVPRSAGQPPPAPSSPPTSPSDHGANAGLSSPTRDLQAEPVDTSPAGKSSSNPAGVPAAGRFDITEAHTNAGMHYTTGAEHATSAQAVGVDRAAQAGRSEAGSDPVGRVGSVAADRPQRPVDLVTKRQDPSTRPDATRHDSSTGPRGRPRKLRSGVARDTDDLQPAAATRAPDPLAAAAETGIIKSRHNDSGPGPGEPESQQRSKDGNDGHHTPDPGAAGGHRGGTGGGAGDDGTGPLTPDDAGSGRSPGYGVAEASRLTEHAAQLSLPFQMNTACGARAEAMLSELRRLGVPATSLGIARSFIPDLSATGLERGYATGAVMKKDLHPTLSFSERVQAGIGRVDTTAGTVERNFSRWMSPVGVRRLSCRSAGWGLGLVG